VPVEVQAAGVELGERGGEGEDVVSVLVQGREEGGVRAGRVGGSESERGEDGVGTELEEGGGAQ
jgi:hypothetical protein